MAADAAAAQAELAAAMQNIAGILQQLQQAAAANPPQAHAGNNPVHELFDDATPFDMSSRIRRDDEGFVTSPCQMGRYRLQTTRFLGSSEESC